MAFSAWLRLGLLLAAVPAVGVGLLFVSSLFVTQKGTPLVTTCACGPNELRFVEAEHITFFHTYSSQEFYWNNRLIDLSGQGFGPGRWAFLPLGLNRLFPAGPPLPEGSGLGFYPAALAPDALPQQRIQARDTALEEAVVWANPRQFTSAEFAQMADCLRTHAAAIDAGLSHGHPFLRYQLTRLVHADFRLHTQPLTFASPAPNPTGGTDSLKIDAYGAVWLRRQLVHGKVNTEDYDVTSINGRPIGGRVPGTTTLLFRQPLTAADDAHAENQAIPGPYPGPSEFSRYRDAQGHLLGNTFQLRYLTDDEERLAAAGKHPVVSR